MGQGSSPDSNSVLTVSQPSLASKHNPIGFNTELRPPTTEAVDRKGEGKEKAAAAALSVADRLGGSDGRRRWERNRRDFFSNAMAETMSAVCRCHTCPTV